MAHNSRWFPANTSRKRRAPDALGEAFGRSSRCAGQADAEFVNSVGRFVDLSLGGCCLDGRLAGIHLDLAWLGLLSYWNPKC